MEIRELLDDYKYNNIILPIIKGSTLLAYYWFSRGGGDEIDGDSRFFDFLDSKSKFLIA